MRAILALTLSLLLTGPAGAAVTGVPGPYRLAQAEPPPAPVPLPPPGTGGEDLTQPDPDQPPASEGDDMTPDDLSLGEIPVIETMELTADIAKRALDSYLMVRTKYENADLESYENLQDFVDQNIEGKNFELDIKAAGFSDVNAWNLAITTVGFAYSGIVDDQSADIRLQISELEADTELAADMKDRMIASLKAMIPSENNKKVIEDLMADPVYDEKLKQLDIVEE